MAKRIVSFILVSVMLLALSFSAFAGYRDLVDGIDMSSGINPVVRIKSDSVFEYVIYARDMQGMTNGDFTVFYDASVLSLEKVQLSGDLSSSFYNDVGGEIYFSFMYSYENTSSAFVLYVLTFSYTKPDIYPSFKFTNLAGTYIRSVAPVVVQNQDKDGGFDYNVEDELPAENKKNIGDVDSDGRITAADARLALRISAGLDVVYLDVYLLADYDGDGDVTAADARLILRVASGLEP